MAGHQKTVSPRVNLELGGGEMMEQEQSWAQPTSEYLTYYPNDTRAPPRPNITPSPELSTDAPSLGPALYAVSSDESSGSHRPPPPLAIPSSSPQTTTLTGTAVSSSNSEPTSSTTALPPFSTSFYHPHHRSPATSLPGYYPSSHTFHHPSSSSHPYQSIFSDYSGHNAMTTDSLAPPSRPPLYHFNSSPRMPSVSSSLSRSAFSSSSSVPQLAPTPPLSHLSSPFTSTPYHPGGYPPPQRQWVHGRQTSTPRIDTDTGGLDIGAGRYSTSPTNHRLPPASPLQPHSFPPPSSSSSSYPSIQHSTTELPIQIKKEVMGMSDSEVLDEGRRSGKGKRRGLSSGRDSLQSWSGEDDIRLFSTPEQPWGIPQDQYKAMNPKDKKQIRNKIGARKFRARRKDYVASLEASAREQEGEITALRSRVYNQQADINDYRRQLGLEPIPAEPDLLPGHSYGLGLSVDHDDGDELDRGLGPMPRGGL